MTFYSAAQLRQAFRQYFIDQGHTAVHSASLLPTGDRSLLFTNAGMVPFKDTFLGHEKRNYQRAVSIQRCMRAGGKHNDLENVGYTARHHTFFEMMGNFSFGDYFKDKAIEMAWTFITQNLAIPTEKLWITIHHSDQDSFDIWHQQIGVPTGRIVRCGDEDNFWSMGDVGPCGPCSEIFYDHGDQVVGGPPGSVDADGDRYVEIWNLVFMQYNRTDQGELIPLPKPSVDTGLGLERLAAVMQGVHDNYETDEMAVLVATARELADHVDEQSQASFKVLADHIRSCAFLIADGILPSNEGRGYVLRRIIRRAIRHGYKVGIQKSPFFYRLLTPLCDLMGRDYPELLQHQATIEQALRQEEQRFSETLSRGLQVLNQKLPELDHQVIPGKLAFDLYDTYGFPLDLTADIAREQGLEIDLKGFDVCMQQQKQRARETNRFKNQVFHFDIATKNNFVGYHKLVQKQAKVIGLFDDQGQVTAELKTSQKGFVYLDKCPFYAESGGQISDSGQLQTETMEFRVLQVIKQGQGHIVFGQVIEGKLSLHQRLEAIVDEHRQQIQRNHSATHILHWALRVVLGDQVEQRGSLVSIDKLRFDFSFNQALTKQQLEQIQQLINIKVLQNDPVVTEIMSLDESKQLGAMALFGEKYAERVRVVKMGDYSIELCGGTHVRQTAEIGQLVVLQEQAVAAGIRRLEAKVGMAALEWNSDTHQLVSKLCQLLNTDQTGICDRLVGLQHQVKLLHNKIDDLQDALQASRNQAVTVEEAQGVSFIRVSLGEVDSKKVRQFMDQYKQKIGSGLVFLFSYHKKGQISCGVTADLTDRWDARILVNQLAAVANGNGGGRVDLATSSADKDRLEAAFNAVLQVITDS